MEASAAREFLFGLFDATATASLQSRPWHRSFDVIRSYCSKPPPTGVAVVSWITSILFCVVGESALPLM